MKSGLLAVALAAAGFVDSVVALAVTSLAVGLLATVAQDLVPAAATAVAEPASRGRTVGTVMTGLLLGILLSRVVSGAVTAWSWRAVFLGASVSVALFTVVAARVLPAFPATTRDAYPALLRSMAGLVRDVAPLRRAAVTQGLLCIAFSGFWSTLALGLAAPPFGLSSLVAGGFGIAGAAGALAAPIAGGVGPERRRAVIRVGAALTAASFLVMALFGRSLSVLIAGTVVFDLGVSPASSPTRPSSTRRLRRRAAASTPSS